MNFISKLFPPKPETFPVLIDMHSHLLPGIDDGSKSVEESIELIKELGKKIGIDFGSGYPSDPKTQRFLEDWSREHDTLPEFVRHSWKTAENVLKRK